MNDSLRNAITEAQEIENDPDRVVREDVTVTRPNKRTRVLQVRLNDDEADSIEADAAKVGDSGIPVSTYARNVLLHRHENELPDTGVVTLPSGAAVTLEVFLEILALAAQTPVRAPRTTHGMMPPPTDIVETFTGHTLGGGVHLFSPADPTSPAPGTAGTAARDR